MSAIEQDACHAPALISVDEAVAGLLRAASAVTQTETIDVMQALGRVLATEVVSSIDVPAHDNSAMDGYAVRSQDCESETTQLTVSQRIPAGTTGVELQPGEAARIFTGAPIPPGADCVVMQEQCTADVDANTVRIDAVVKHGDNIRRAGEDIENGRVVLQSGVRLRQQELGLLASVGVQRVEVMRRLRVACFFTGDELVEPGAALEAGQLYNSNRYTLNGFLQKHDCVVNDYGIVADDLDSTVRVLSEAAQDNDLVLTSGGVSVGEEDYVRLALQQLGELDFWRIAMKPGKPVAFGKIKNALFLGLPGNPVSVFVTAQVFALPLMRAMMGESQQLPHTYSVTADFSWPSVKRQEYLRARLVQGDGDTRAEIYPHQGSGVLSSASWADGLVVVPTGNAIDKGDSVQYIPLD